MPRVAIVVIGNEILSGKVEELNAKFAMRFLRDAGADLERVVVIPDVLSAIRDEVRACSHAFDFVLTSGGVGPTHDDITYEGVAAAFGVPLAEHTEVADMLRTYFKGSLTDDHLRMARFPQGAEVHVQEGLPIPIVSKHNVYIFPGIPPLFQTSLQTFRGMLAGKPFVGREVYCNKDEGVIAAALRKVQLDYADLTLGSYPFRDDTGLFRVRITIEGRDHARVDAAWELVKLIAA